MPFNPLDQFDDKEYRGRPYEEVVSELKEKKHRCSCGAEQCHGHYGLSLGAAQSTLRSLNGFGDERAARLI